MTKQKQALNKIANFVLPTYRINNVDYVKYETACAIRQIARDINETPNKKEITTQQKAKRN